MLEAFVLCFAGLVVFFLVVVVSLVVLARDGSSVVDPRFGELIYPPSRVYLPDFGCSTRTSII